MKGTPDFDDLHRANGADAARQAFDDAFTGENGGKSVPGATPRFKLQPFDEIAVGTDGVYLVKGIIPRTGLTVAWGPPKCGKSFWAFDLVMHIALGWEYRGRRVRQGPVVYLALEGGTGFAGRVEAWRTKHLSEQADAVPFYLVVTAIDLVKDHPDLIGCIRVQTEGCIPAVVVIDTLNRSLAGSESDDKDMAAYVRAADAIRNAFGCAVIIVHHCGIDASRPRGHTSLTGAVDAQIAVKRDAADNVLVAVEYMKDGPAGAEISSKLVPVDVGVDADGDPMTSCVIVPLEGQEVAKPVTKKAKLPKAAQIALRALSQAIDECGEAAPTSNHIPPSVKVTTVERWREYAYRIGISPSEKPRARQAAFQRASQYLVASEFVAIWDETAWIAK
jgi:AAA domain